MSDSSSANETFVAEIRTVLQHLYDPAILSRTPLLGWLGLEKRHNPANVLRQILTSGIQVLRPGNEIPQHANAWRIYHVLNLRYIEQASQREVAASLALSPRQLRRLEWLAAQTLADLLWTQHNLSEAQVAPGPSQSASEMRSEGEPPPANRVQELQWLRASFPTESERLVDLVQTAVRTVTPVAKAVSTEIDIQLRTELGEITGQLPALRQALVNLLLATIALAPEGEVTLSADSVEGRICLRIEAALPSDLVRPVPTDTEDHLAMARDLLDVFGAAMEVDLGKASQNTCTISVSLPRTERALVLGIDDNSDALQLLERYLTGTRYRFVGCRDPEQALNLAEELRPDLIVLDIMLPAIDGWELLGRLREHPTLHEVPLLVSTILPQEQLALTLGAAAFLRKPLSRQPFLAALDRLVARQESC